LTACYICVEN